MSRRVLIREKESADYVTGLLMFTETEYLTYLTAEPSYIKLYVGNTKILTHLQPRTFAVLLECLKVVDYENTLNITFGMKVKMCEVLKITVKKDGKVEFVPNVIDRHLKLLCKHGALIKKSTGTYIVNPKVIGKGQWKSVMSTIKKLTYKDGDLPKLAKEKKQRKSKE